MWELAPEIGRKIIAGAFPIKAFRKPRAVPDTLSGTLGRVGALEVRLAATRKEVRKAQRLRFKVFFGEGGAIPDPKAALTRRDADKFDAFCDHLIVIDHEGKTRGGKIKPTVVGAYRLLRSDVAIKKRGFYSSTEYDIAPLLARHPGKRFLELGRSCVLAAYRGKKTIELLWKGILAYIRAYNIDALIGCASLEGSNPLAHAVALSFLSHHAAAAGEWSVRARRELHVPMNMLEASAFDPRKALAGLPPLIKGYLRVGAKFGDGAVADRKFNTTDVFVVMPVAEMDARYLEFFGGPCSERRAA
ncbi:ornithine--acyl-ACP N-acyltransferase OlsB [Rhodoblastus sphagnicola]|uniref:L-ornithine N(alpha)-acyltransferase n=1 Tax=Rhodoblastus sphagnicola TaxID=333368 RepID=A0A2S6NA27_9HYPH|nr:GNAT family N-acyltransferase [Rhodoblastus sphagnicola]MBB4198847.1 putative hemolysin [Rhodoblastus sphagnicola]PPQ31470.1 ornithine--acyl-ACP N-acyltransferase OlsB [Rhodoblastus sphagnicola]